MVFSLRLINVTSSLSSSMPFVAQCSLKVMRCAVLGVGWGVGWVKSRLRPLLFHLNKNTCRLALAYC